MADRASLLAGGKKKLVAPAPKPPSRGTQTILCMLCHARFVLPWEEEAIDAKASAKGWITFPANARRKSPETICPDCARELATYFRTAEGAIVLRARVTRLDTTGPESELRDGSLATVKEVVLAGTLAPEDATKNRNRLARHEAEDAFARARTTRQANTGADDYRTARCAACGQAIR